MNRPAAPRRRPAVAHAPPVPPLATLGVAAAGLAALAGSAALATWNGGRAPRVDRVVRRITGPAQPRVRDRLAAVVGRGVTGRPTAVAIAGVGGKWVTGAASALAAAAVARERTPRHAAPVLAAFAAAYGVHGVLKPALRRPRPLMARLTGKRTAGFPSGHAARAAAVAGIVGYAAVAEGWARPRVVVPLGVAASVAGGGRLLTDRHWLTDVVGGWGLGVAVAALCALWYDGLDAGAA
jgi:undecaprenyl-diphosphatase